MSLQIDEGEAQQYSKGRNQTPFIQSKNLSTEWLDTENK